MNSSRLTRAVLAISIALLLAALSVPVSAQTLGRRISYQGQLSGASGATTIQFRIFDATATPVWGPEIHVVTPDGQGRFVAVVGVTNLDSAPADGIPDLDQLAPDALELEVAVEDGGGSLIVLSPRQRLFAAFHASSATFAQTVADGAIDTAQLANNAVTGAQVADGSIGGADITDESIGSADIADSSVTGADIANSSITGADIANSSITGTDIANGSITGSDIANDTITSSNLATSVAEQIPPTGGGIRSIILSNSSSGCPTFNGVQIYTPLGLHRITRDSDGGTSKFMLCQQ